VSEDKGFISLAKILKGLGVGLALQGDQLTFGAGSFGYAYPYFYYSGFGVGFGQIVF
jgi:hypothetical protein